MRCPKCGDELQIRSPKAKYGFCENCRKKIRLNGENTNKNNHQSIKEKETLSHVTPSSPSKQSTGNGLIIGIIIVIIIYWFISGIV